MSIEKTQSGLADCMVKSGKMPSAMEYTILKVITAIGVGETGAKTVRSMGTFPLLRETVTFAYACADNSALDGTDASTIPLCGKLEDGFDSAGCRDILTSVYMVVVLAGLDEHVEFGVIPLIAGIARELGVLVVCIVAMPLTTENSNDATWEALLFLHRNVDCLMPVSVPFFKNTCQKVPSKSIQEKIIGVMCNTVRSIVMLFPDNFDDGLICLDFADGQTVLSPSCIAGAGLGIASGKRRASKAAKRALDRLPFDMHPTSFKRLMYNITAPVDVTPEEIQEIHDIIAKDLTGDCSPIFGLQISTEIEGAIWVSILASTDALGKTVKWT